jgi:hypothetical protein
MTLNRSVLLTTPGDLTTPGSAPRAQTVEIECGVIDREVMTPADRGQHWGNNVFRDVVDALAAGTDEMVVVLGVAGDIGGHMPLAFEAAGHPILDLLLEGAIHRGTADRRVRPTDPLVKLLRREGAPCRSECFCDDHALSCAPTAAGRQARIDGCGAHRIDDRPFDTESHLP